MSRNWNELVKRHSAFWNCAPVDRPLICAIHKAYQDTELVARLVGERELLPDRVDPRPLLAVYDEIAQARESIGDDMLATAEPLLGIPWLEAMCGCRVLVPDGKSLWPEPPENNRSIHDLSFSANNPWFVKLCQVIEQVVDHVQGRYAVSMSHLRGPTDILVALLGSQQFLTLLYDDPERIEHLAKQAAEVWVQVARAEEKLVPAFRDGFGIRQFGLWSPERSVWLQDDTSAMMSLRHYCKFFLKPMETMSVFPYGVLHLHAPSIHLAETFATVPNIRAINVYFDSQTVTVVSAMPTLKRLQALHMPLVLAKDVYQGFTLEEYSEILEHLSPQGLSVHLKAESIEEGRAVMGRVSELAHASKGASV
jgi:hypothetical protein